MPDARARHYPSRVDAGLVVFLFAPLAIGLSVVGTLATRVPAFPGRTLILALLIATFAFTLWVLLTTGYAIDATCLTVRSGPFRWVIPLKDIHTVTATRDPRSAPATSLERLRIEYGAQRSIMVSPRERAEFMGDLRAHGVHVSG